MAGVSLRSCWRVRERSVIIATVPRSQSIQRAQLAEVADMIGRLLGGVADGSLTAPTGLVSRLEGAESALRIIAGLPSDSEPK
jgi:hypothetical protein